MLHEVGEGSDGGEDGAQEEILGEQLALDEAKHVARKVTEHGHTCKCVVHARRHIDSKLTSTIQFPIIH